MENHTIISEIVSAMKEKAENAYLNGEIATARHLAATALENWPDNTPIQQISWCFAILLHCFKNETDQHWLVRQYYNTSYPIKRDCRFSTKDADEDQSISFIMEVMRPSISPTMVKKWQEKFLNMPVLKINDDVSTALLIETVVEFLCFLGADKWGGDWRTFFINIGRTQQLCLPRNKQLCSAPKSSNAYYPR